MEDLENKIMNSSYGDDVFNIDEIISTDPDEALWDKLTQNIIDFQNRTRRFGAVLK